MKRAAAVGQLGSRPRILVVENHPASAEYVQLLLENAGYEVSAIVATGEAAIATANHEEPDLVLMDIWLDGAMSGIEAAARLRTTRSIPVVFLSGDTSRATADTARFAQPEAFLIKPVDAATLLRAVAAFVGPGEPRISLDHKAITIVEEKLDEIAAILDGLLKRGADK